MDIKLTSLEAVVLANLLRNNSSNPSGIITSTEAEKQVLWNLECLLEKQLPPEYDLIKAQKEILPESTENLTNNPKAKLLLKTFDGSLIDCKVIPKNKETQVEFNIKYYDYDGNGEKLSANIIFNSVIAVDFQVNYFNNCIGAELSGFFQILSTEKKIALIERVFSNRLRGYLDSGDYDYDPNEPNDMLNYRLPIEEIYKDLDSYHLYQQQTDGGIYHILAKSWDLIHKQS